MSPWWTALAPVTLPLECGPHRHELRWSDGMLTAPAHPDADRERALAALGADPSPCLQILDAWNRHADDLEVLVAAGRGPGDLLEAPGETDSAVGVSSYRPLAPVLRPGRMGARGGWAAYSQLSIAVSDDEPVDELWRLLRLGSGLPHRLAATVIATWAERIAAGDPAVAAALPKLDAALYGRVRAALLPWLGSADELRLTMLPPGEVPAIGREADALAAALPFAWLRDVWINGLTVVLDRFCLAAEVTAPDRWTLACVTRELAEETLRITT